MKKVTPSAISFKERKLPLAEQSQDKALEKKLDSFLDKVKQSAIPERGSLLEKEGLELLKEIESQKEKVKAAFRRLHHVIEPELENDFEFSPDVTHPDKIKLEKELKILRAQREEVLSALNPAEADLEAAGIKRTEEGRRRASSDEYKQAISDEQLARNQELLEWIGQQAGEAVAIDLALRGAAFIVIPGAAEVQIAAALGKVGIKIGRQLVRGGEVIIEVGGKGLGKEVVKEVEKLGGRVIKEELKAAEKQVAKEVVKGAAEVGKMLTCSLDDLSSLRGARWKEAENLIPKEWIREPLKKGSGIKFVNPNKKGEQILLEKGWPSAKDPLHKGPYMKISKDGQVVRIPLAGNPILE